MAYVIVPPGYTRHAGNPVARLTGMRLRVALVFAIAAYGAGSDPLNRDTPQSSVISFLAACHEHDYRRAWKYLDLRYLPANQRFKDGPQLALQLETILDHDGQFDVGSLSRNAEGTRELVGRFSLDSKEVELQLERVTLRSGAAVWVFSANSVALIPQLARLATDSPMERHLPDPLVNWKIMDTAVWRWIAMALLAGALAGLSRLISAFTVAWLQPGLKRLWPRVDASRLEVFTGPLRLLVAVAGFRAGMEWIGPSAAVRLFLERGVSLLFFLALAWLSISVVDLAAAHLRRAAQLKYRSFSDSVLPPLARVAKITISVVALAAVLASWGYNTTTILAGLGVGGVALALAAQKTIENLFGGVAVIADRPVAVGDFCRVGDQVGTVEDIGLRSTRVRTLNRTVLTVPNGQFSSMALENFSKRDKMWFHLTLNLRRDTTAGQIRKLLDSTTQTLVEHPKVEVGNLPVRFVGVGTYSLDVEIFTYVLTRDYDEFLKIQQELFLWILDAVEAAGTGLALPTQATYITGPAGAAPPRWPTAGGTREERRDREVDMARR